MITRILYPEERKLYDSVVTHPLQTWAWGDFQISQGHDVVRLGIFEGKKIVGGYTVAFHQVPKLNYTVGTCLRGPAIDHDMVANLKNVSRDKNCIFIKLEPDILEKSYDANGIETNLLPTFDRTEVSVSPKVAFYPYSFILDLTKTEQELLASMHPKTRYNIKVANRYNVAVREETNDAGFETYLSLLFETTARQGFYLHSEQYHRDLWRILKPTGIPHIMTAYYQDAPLASFMLFKLGDRFFYPYGGSLDTNREVMAPTLLMWESIKLGKSLGAKSFDMWGALSPKAKESEQGYGFHRFKQGFGGTLHQYVGTFDLVLNYSLYSIYNTVDQYRWKYLRLKARLASL